MSSFLAATVAMRAQPTLVLTRPSRKKPSTVRLAKLRIATSNAVYLIEVYGVPETSVPTLRARLPSRLAPGGSTRGRPAGGRPRDARQGFSTRGEPGRTQPAVSPTLLGRLDVSSGNNLDQRHLHVRTECQAYLKHARRVDKESKVKAKPPSFTCLAVARCFVSRDRDVELANLDLEVELVRRGRDDPGTDRDQT
jgi:hypothetical protein